MFGRFHGGGLGSSTASGADSATAAASVADSAAGSAAAAAVTTVKQMKCFTTKPECQRDCRQLRATGHLTVRT